MVDPARIGRKEVAADRVRRVPIERDGTCGRRRRQCERKHERIGREPRAPSDRGGQYRKKSSHDRDRKRAVREAKRVLEPEDPEQER